MRTATEKSSCPGRQTEVPPEGMSAQTRPEPRHGSAACHVGATSPQKEGVGFGCLVCAALMEAGARRGRFAAARARPPGMGCRHCGTPLNLRRPGSRRQRPRRRAGQRGAAAWRQRPRAAVVPPIRERAALRAGPPRVECQPGSSAHLFGRLLQREPRRRPSRHANATRGNRRGDIGRHVCASGLACPQRRRPQRARRPGHGVLWAGVV